MENFKTINSALFQFIKKPFFALVIILVLIVAATVILAVREIKNDI